MTIDTLIDRLGRQTIDEAYEAFGYDHALAESVDRPEQRDISRDRFLAAFEWRVTPSTELVRRFFNQVNTFYAERWITRHPMSDPIAMLLESNRLALFRQDKSTGWRFRQIEFGVRNHLDFMDPRRRLKWLAGLDANHVPMAMDEWASTASSCPVGLEAALALAMVVIAVHPFADANGRCARLVLTWLCLRWQIEPVWLNEGADGELLRTGVGIGATEYLMAMLMIFIGDGHNVIPLTGGGRRPDREGNAMFESVSRRLTDLRSQRQMLLNEPVFVELSYHLRYKGHLCNVSPRFQSLRSVIS